MPHERALARALRHARRPTAAFPGPPGRRSRPAGHDPAARPGPASRRAIGRWASTTSCMGASGRDLRLDARRIAGPAGGDAALLRAGRHRAARIRRAHAAGWRSGEVFDGLATASLDRVVGRTDRRVDAACRRGAAPAPAAEGDADAAVHRTRERRAHRARRCCRSIPSGSAAPAPCRLAPQPTGAGPAGRRTTCARRPARRRRRLGRRLAAARCRHECAALLANALRHGDDVSLTLCGERSAQTLVERPRRHLRRAWAGLFGRQGAAAVLEALCMKIIARDIPPRSAWALEQAGVHPLLARLYAARGVLGKDELDDGLARLLPPAAHARRAARRPCCWPTPSATASAVHRRRLRLRRRHRLRGRRARPAAAGRAARRATWCRTAWSTATA